MNQRILLIEDEPGLVLTLSDLLRAEGYEVESAVEGGSGLNKALSGSFDLIILDLMLPGRSGFEICQELRRQGKDMAILMLTAKTQLDDKVAGLKLGADDYLTKPFEPQELLARVEALLRRTRKEKRSALNEFQFANVRLNFDKGEATRDGIPVKLASKEMELLRYLIDRRGNTVSRQELLEAVWGYQPGVTSRTVDVHIAWLRQKLEARPQSPRHILTVRGIGYRFVP